MLPSTEDVIKISKLIAKEEQKCAEELKCDPRDISRLRYLTELSPAHVILLNRKRSGKAQRITINDYLRKEEDMAVQDIYESLTVTEKVLVKNIERFTIRGKKGRAVPAIFTKEMQRNTEVLLGTRKLIASSNSYLFANPSTENSFLWSNKVLKEIAMACNIENIEAITATCLRKHIVTIAQLISMGDNDLKQKTDDKLQIAKVSKLLLLMENKSVRGYRGKSSEEIDLDIPEFLSAKDHPSCSEKKVENISKSTKSNVNSGMEEKPVDEESDDILQLLGNSQNKGKKKAKNEKTKHKELYGYIDQENEENKGPCVSIDKREVRQNIKKL
ncbi:hypothetical protein JTB14_035610 [Gonioctena quinquepunctata]|nr:hypothetical protein JTB14_035610 [Gonioctena quinquepunctata]